MIWALLACGPSGALGWFVVVEGRVVDEDGAPVPVAEVELRGEDGSRIATVYSAPDGTWSSPIYGRELRDNLLELRVTAEGFAEGLARVDVTLASPEVHSLRAGPGDTFNTVNRSLPVVRLAREGSSGGASVQLVHALTGDPVGERPYVLRRGWNASPEAEAVDTGTADGNGYLDLSVDIPGMYTVEIPEEEVWERSVFPVLLTTSGNRERGAVSPALQAHYLRASLLWPSGPRDLDLHLSSPSSSTGRRYHIWSGDPQYPGRSEGTEVEAILARSDADGDGPETVEIYQRPGEGNTYLTVFDNEHYEEEDSTGLAESSATLQVWSSGKTSAYQVDPQAVATWWRPLEFSTMNDIYEVEQYASDILPTDDTRF